MDAFRAFSSLEDIWMPFNGIEIIHRYAFRGLKNVKSLTLSYNFLHTIEESALDDLVNLQQLDLKNNHELESYTTNAWHFCNNVEEYNLGKDSTTFYKNFKNSENTEDYCSTKLDFPLDKCIRSGGGTIDCTSVEDFRSTPCNIRSKNFTNILFNFPKDKETTMVENYYEGEDNAFFRQFNAQDKTMNYTKHVKELTLYETKIDLNKISELTCNRTQLVTIKADTVWMSGPININHHLNIQARVVALDYPISMNMSKKQFVSKSLVETWALQEEYVYLGNILMNKRSFGLVTVLQNVHEIPAVKDTDVCLPQVTTAEEREVDFSNWFDRTTINLHYVCAMTIMKSNKNAKLVDDIGNYMLGFVYNASIVGDQGTFIAAQRFSRLIELNQDHTVHNVPSYSISIVGNLASLMADRMTNYRDNERQQELELTLATGRAADMQINFEIVKMQQQQYFSTEQSILDSIWASTDNQWDFDFSHRNGIEEQITGSMNSIQDQIFALQEQELKSALAEATMSQKHIDDIIEAYENQIDKLNEMVKSSLYVQSQFIEDLNKKTYNMKQEIDNLEIAIEEYKHEQEVKAAKAIFGAILSFGIGLATGDLGALDDIADLLEQMQDILDLINDLVDIVSSCQDIINMIDDLDLGDIGDLADISINLSTNFKDALQNMVKLKMKATDFDQLDIVATIRIDKMDEKTGKEIAEIEVVEEAMLSVSSVGRLLIDEACEFADKLLDLSEQNGLLDVAKNDRERATQQIEEITRQLADLEEMKNQFTEDREQAREEYEEELKRLQEQYHNISEELKAEFKEKILLSFNNFQMSFDALTNSYDTQMFMLISSIHQKIYGLKEHSMNQRSMIMSLYLDFCDADFYNSFRSCQEQNMPYMSDDFDTLISKLIDIQWDSVISNAEIPGKPVQMKGTFKIDSDSETTYGGKTNYIVSTLKKTNQVEINLRDLDEYNRFDDFWRIRIETMKLTLLDDNSDPIQSAGTGFGAEIQIRIHYPTFFNDTDNYKNSVGFLAQNFACNADYVTEGAGKSTL